MAKGLTDKQQRFVEEYLIDLNATQAAIRAGYSEKTAQEQSSRLLSNVMVAEAISDLKAKRSNETGINAAWVLKRLAREVEADAADLYDENGNLKAIHDWPLIWRQGLVAGMETVREKHDGEELSTVNKVKLSDRLRRLELIGKHVDIQAFKDKVEHDVTQDLAAIIEKRRAQVHGDEA